MHPRRLTETPESGSSGATHIGIASSERLNKRLDGAHITKLTERFSDGTPVRTKIAISERLNKRLDGAYITKLTERFSDGTPVRTKILQCQ